MEKKRVSLHGAIYASDCQEIADNQEPTAAGQNLRYADNSQKYAEGFRIDRKFESPVFNGIMHKLTGRIKEVETCDLTGKIDPIRVKRYNSAKEVEDPQYIDDNYIKTTSVSSFLSHRYKKRYTKMNELAHFYGFPQDEGNYYAPRADCLRSRGCLLSAEDPIYLIESKLYESFNAVPLNNGTKLLPRRRNIRVLGKGESIEKNTCHYFAANVPDFTKMKGETFEVRRTYFPASSVYFYPVIIFDNNFTFRGVTINKGVRYKIKGNKFRIRVWGTTVLSLEGLDHPPLLEAIERTDEEIKQHINGLG